MELGDFYYRQGYKIVEKSIIFAINHFRLISLNCRKIKVLFILKFEIVKNILDGIPHTPPEDGLLLYNFILNNIQIYECLFFYSTFIFVGFIFQKDFW